MTNKSRPSTHFTIRMCDEEREALKALADKVDMSMAAFIRAKVFDGLPIKAPKSNRAIDYEMLSKVLLLLGESRIANNLNQLAKHANMGTLNVPISEIEEQLNEAYLSIQFMRRTLIKSLGLKP